MHIAPEKQTADQQQDQGSGDGTMSHAWPPGCSWIASRIVALRIRRLPVASAGRARRRRRLIGNVRRPRRRHGWRRIDGAPQQADQSDHDDEHRPGLGETVRREVLQREQHAHRDHHHRAADGANARAVSISHGAPLARRRRDRRRAPTAGKRPAQSAAPASNAPPYRNPTGRGCAATADMPKTTRAIPATGA